MLFLHIPQRDHQPFRLHDDNARDNDLVLGPAVRAQAVENVLDRVDRVHASKPTNRGSGHTGQGRIY